MNPGPKKTQSTFWGDFRKFFGRGLAILLPSIITLWILWQLVVFVYTNVGAPINAGIRLAILEVMPRVVGEPAPAAPGEAAPGSGLPKWWTPTGTQIEAFKAERLRVGDADVSDAEAVVKLRRRAFERWWKSRWYLEATGLLVAIVLIYLAGLILGNFFGRRIYARLEKFLGRIPVWKHIYPHVKQLIDLLMGDRQIAFKKAVLVQYPRPGIWSVGLVTGKPSDVVRDTTGRECLTVFVASTPTPFTGFTILVPVEEIVDLPITIDQAVRFVITAGVLSFEAAPRTEPPPALAGAPASSPSAPGA
ncbi:MAG: DUF502 domain-containing protein [Phycisphaerales bacterium]|nr:DUF502 domain-containing protein [Phycisphaerales bacterium]